MGFPRVFLSVDPNICLIIALLFFILHLKPCYKRYVVEMLSAIILLIYFGLRKIACLKPKCKLCRLFIFVRRGCL